MANKQYSDYDPVTTLADGDMFPLETAGGHTRRILWSSIKTLINALSLAVSHPIGSYYVQYPNEASSTLTTAFPSAQSPAALFGGTWTLMYSTEGIVFQTEGYDGAGRTDGLMEDQFQGHRYVGGTKRIHDSADGVYGALSGVGTVDDPLARNSGTYSYDLDYTSGPVIDGPNGEPRTGTRTAHRNRLFRVYRRDA